jgi:hypothetical protein
MLNPVRDLFFGVLKTHGPNQCTVVSVQVELLSVEALMEMLSDLTITSSSRRLTQKLLSALSSILL